MSKTKYKNISYFNFAVLTMGIIDYLNKRDLPDKLKTKPDIPFFTSSMMFTYGSRVKKLFTDLQNHKVNESNILASYIKYDLVIKEQLNHSDKDSLEQCGINFKGCKFKYIITDKAIKLVQRLNFGDNHSLFSLYGLSLKYINVLSAFIVQDTELTEDEVVSVLLNNKILSEENNSCREVINKLIIKKLIIRKPRDEEKTKYHITDLGRNVFNLVLDMDEALAVEEKSERRVFEINTPYKTVLAFPLSWK